MILGDTVERVEVPEEELLSFPCGMVGFEEFDRYALFELEAPLYLLQAVDDPQVGFVVISPFLVDPSYEARIGKDHRALLKLRGDQRPELFCVVTLSSEGVPSTVNLRAPVAVSPSNGVGVQAILQDSPYAVRHPLAVSPEGTLVLPDTASVASRSADNGGGRPQGRREAARC